MFSNKVIVLMLFTYSFLHLHVSSFEYQVGGTRGWTVPSYNDSKIYNVWASENRFLLGDTIRFNYKKDSVMEVAYADYVNCNSSHPKFFSNSGNTVFRLDYPGPFYFISGVSGHCEKGQKMIIKVIPEEEERYQHRNKSIAYSSHGVVLSFGVAKLSFIQCILSSSFFLLLACYSN